jgi:aminotransferase
MNNKVDSFAKLAKRTQPFQESVIREMTRVGDEAGAVNLSQGLPDFDPPPEVLDAAVSAIRNQDNQYTFPFGALHFREAIAAKSDSYNGIEADPETEVTVTCGVSEAIMAAVLALTDPGDEALILEPWYENYVPACLMAGVTPRFVPLQEPDYHIDGQALRQACNSNTRMIFINTPHNPTGRVFSLDEMQTIAQLCHEYDILAVTDETYEHILYDGRQHVSMGSLPGMRERTVTISGLGKSYAVTGWRVGWAIAAPALTAVIRKVHDYLTICAPAPFQTAGIVALGLPSEYYENSRSLYSARRRILLDALDAAHLAYREPEGAYYVMVDFGSTEWDQGDFDRPDWTADRSFSEFLARRVGVAVVPGSSFYATVGKGTSRVRFNFAKREETLLEAARRLAIWSNGGE